METGITHLVLRGQHGELADVLPKIKAWGYDGIEVLLTDDGDLNPTSTSADFARVRKLADDAGLTLQSMCIATTKGRGSLVTGKDEDAELWRNTARTAARACQALGVDTVLVIPGGVTREIPYDLCYERALAGLKGIRDIADETGVNLAVEYVWNDFFLSPLELRACLDEVNHPHIGFYMDTGNMMAFGWPEQWIRILGKHVKKIHTKNFRRRPKWEWPSLLDDGDADWNAIMAAVREIGYDGALISEMSGTPEQHEQNARFTRTLYA